MQVKDKIVTWFIKNVVTPRREIIDRPGFIVTTFTENKRTTYLREILLPERLFELMENKIVECYGDEGKQTLYSAGKKFVYLYSSISNFPNIKDTSTKELSDFAYYLLRYIETMFAQQANHELDFEKRILSIEFKNYIICRNNGLGYIMMDGALAGLWAYELQDRTIEGIQLECQGRGDQQCKILCAPGKELFEKYHLTLKEHDLPEIKYDNFYRVINEIRPAAYSNKSLKLLINAGFFKYHEGNLSYQNSRFFICESHILYFLEEEIKKLPNGEQFLYQICFDYGVQLHEINGQDNFRLFIQDFFTGLGFGDIHVDTKDLSITFRYYPWSIFSEKSSDVIMRVIISGFVSSCLKKKIEFHKVEVNVGQYLKITIRE